MSLSEFSIIVAVDSQGGISKNGNIPWSSKDDMDYFRTVTTGDGKNAVIMGRGTYESIGCPLPGRLNIVLSKTLDPVAHNCVTIKSTLADALLFLGDRGSCKEVFVIGGQDIYLEAINSYLYLCKKVYITKFKTPYSCDQFFPYEKFKGYKLASPVNTTTLYSRSVYVINEDPYAANNHPEKIYLNALKKIRDTGEPRIERTGVGATGLFGLALEYDISERFPLLTTKKMFSKAIVEELLFFISGKTDTKLLEEKGVKIWSGNTSEEFLKQRGLKYERGDMGPLYGFQWRHWGAEYDGCAEPENYKGKGVDQLKQLVENIKTDPFSRRHILSAWNVSQLDEMAIPPCHILAQFYVSSDKKYLDCQLYQRSADMFLGVPFNIASYSLLTYMIAHLTNLKPRKFIHILGDAHIYKSHSEQVNRQLKRHPYPLPTLSFRNPTKLLDIEDFTVDSFIFNNYISHPVITAEMAI